MVREQSLAPLPQLESRTHHTSPSTTFSSKQMPLGLVISLQAGVSEGHASNQSPRDANHAPHTHTRMHSPLVQVGSEGQGAWHR